MTEMKLFVLMEILQILVVVGSLSQIHSVKLTGVMIAGTMVLLWQDVMLQMAAGGVMMDLEEDGVEM